MKFKYNFINYLFPWHKECAHDKNDFMVKKRKHIHCIFKRWDWWRPCVLCNYSNSAYWMRSCKIYKSMHTVCQITHMHVYLQCVQWFCRKNDCPLGDQANHWRSIEDGCLSIELSSNGHSVGVGQFDVSVTKHVIYIQWCIILIWK